MTFCTKAEDIDFVNGLILYGKKKISKTIFFWITYQDETFMSMYFYAYCSENAALRYDRRSTLKKHEKMMNFSDF